MSNKNIEFTNEAISRQLDIVPTTILSKKIAIIGCGAIGSWTAIALAKMGFRDLRLIDADEVDVVNMSSQFFMKNDIGNNKARGLANNLRLFTGDEGFSFTPEQWKPGRDLSGFDIVVQATDSMATRKEIFNSLADRSPLCKALIDPRMGAETAMLYVINPMSGEDQAMYKKTLYSDQEAVQAPCTAKSTTYCALILSGFVAKAVRDKLMNAPYTRSLNMTLKGNAFEVQQRG